MNEYGAISDKGEAIDFYVVKFKSFLYTLQEDMEPDGNNLASINFSVMVFTHNLVDQIYICYWSINKNKYMVVLTRTVAVTNIGVEFWTQINEMSQIKYLCLFSKPKITSQ